MQKHPRVRSSYCRTSVCAEGLAQLPAARIPDVFAVIGRGIPNSDQVVYLISRDGQKFPVHEDVLKASSNFFKAALENGMKESGKCPLVWAAMYMGGPGHSLKPAVMHYYVHTYPDRSFFSLQ
jgi:hypothetical protein